MGLRIKGGAVLAPAGVEGQRRLVARPRDQPKLGRLHDAIGVRADGKGLVRRHAQGARERPARRLDRLGFQLDAVLFADPKPRGDPVACVQAAGRPHQALGRSVATINDLAIQIPKAGPDGKIGTGFDASANTVQDHGDRRLAGRSLRPFLRRQHRLAQDDDARRG